MSYYKYHYLSLKKSEYEKLYAFHSVLKTFMLSNDWNLFWEGLNYFEDPLNLPKINLMKNFSEKNVEHIHFSMAFESSIQRSLNLRIEKDAPETLQVSFQIDPSNNEFFTRTSVLWFGNRYVEDLERKFTVHRLFDERASTMKNWKELEQVAHDFSARCVRIAKWVHTEFYPFLPISTRFRVDTGRIV